MSNATRKRLGPTIDRQEVRYFVYRLHDADGAVIYIGRSCDVAGRIRSHHSAGKPWLRDVRSVTMVGPMTWDDAIDRERDEIAREQPRGNVALTARDHRPMVARRSVRIA